MSSSALSGDASQTHHRRANLARPLGDRAPVHWAAAHQSLPVECRSYLYLAQTLSVKGKAGHVVPGSDLKIKPSVAPSNLHRALAVHAKRSDLRITECKERLQAVVTGDDDLLVALKNSDGHGISCGQPDGWICPSFPDDSALEIDR